MAAGATATEPLYPSRAGAGALLGRQLWHRFPSPIVILGVAPTGVEVAAAAAKSMNSSFDVIIGSLIRLDDAVIGAVAEDGDSTLDPDFQPKFDMMDALNEAIDRARRAIKTERLLFRGQRQLRSVEGMSVVIVDGQVTSPWKVLAAADFAHKMGASHVGIAAPVSTQPVQERIRARKLDFISPTILLEPDGHSRPFGDPDDPSAERLRSIVLAREAG